MLSLQERETHTKKTMLQSPDIYVAALFMSSLRRILRCVSPGRSELVNCQPSVSALSPAQHSTDKVTPASTAHYSTSGRSDPRQASNHCPFPISNVTCKTNFLENILNLSLDIIYPKTKSVIYIQCHLEERK